MFYFSVWLLLHFSSSQQVGIPAVLFFNKKKVLLVLQLAKMMKKIVMLKEPADLSNSPVRLVQKIQVVVLE